MKTCKLLSRVFLAVLLAGTQPAQAQNLQWVNPISGAGDDRAYATASDADGNVYVAGVFSVLTDFDPGPGTARLTATGSYDAFIAKYTSSGDYVWAHALGGTVGGNDAYAIAVDPSGDVVVSGDFAGTVDFDFGSGDASHTAVGSLDMFLLKLDKDGNFKWVNAIGGRYADYANCLNIDAASGNILVSGGFADLVDFDPSLVGTPLDASKGGLFLAQYDKDGKYKWAGNIGCNGGSQYLNAMAKDAKGNIYVTGSFNGAADFDPGPGSAMMTSTGLQDVFLARYDSAGKYTWSKHMGNYPNVAMGNGLVVSKSGALTIAGIFYETVDFNGGSGTPLKLTALFPVQPNIFMAQYDLDGNCKWANNIGASTSSGGSINASGLSIDKYDNLYMSGYFSLKTDFDPGSGIAFLTSKQIDMFFAKYDPSGEYLWAHSLPQHNGVVVGGSVSEATIRTDDAGYIFLSGSFADTTNFATSGKTELGALLLKDGFVAKYNGSTTGIPETAAANPFFVLYPNPTVGQLHVQTRSGLSANAEIRLMSMTGKQIAVWDHLPPGKELSFDLQPFALSAGTYFLQLTDGGQQTTQRFVLR